MRKRSDQDGAIHESVGNALTDLGLPNGREGMLKVEIAGAVSATIRNRDLTQAAASKIIGADQGKVSELLRGRLTGFSLGRLLMFLVKLGAMWTSRFRRRTRTDRAQCGSNPPRHKTTMVLSNKKVPDRLRIAMSKHLAAARAKSQI